MPRRAVLQKSKHYSIASRQPPSTGDVEEKATIDEGRCSKTPSAGTGTSRARKINVSHRTQMLITGHKGKENQLLLAMMSSVRLS